jgi:hypothetical protein
VGFPHRWGPSTVTASLYWVSWCPGSWMPPRSSRREPPGVSAGTTPGAVKDVGPPSHEQAPRERAGCSPHPVGPDRCPVEDRRLHILVDHQVFAGTSHSPNKQARHRQSPHCCHKSRRNLPIAAIKVDAASPSVNGPIAVRAVTGHRAGVGFSSGAPGTGRARRIEAKARARHPLMRVSGAPDRFANSIVCYRKPR